jgi:mannose-1-phosphate guanylyltransferase
VTKVELCVGHLGELFRVTFSEGTVLPDGLELGRHWEPDEPLGTAGALRGVPGVEGTFLVMKGDILHGPGLPGALACHRDHGATVTIAVQRKRVDIHLGVRAILGATITGYREKPTLHYDVSMGISVYEAEALARLPARPSSFPELVQRLLDVEDRVTAYRSDAMWFDLGTMAEYERTVAELGRRDASP